MHFFFNFFHCVMDRDYVFEEQQQELVVCAAAAAAAAAAVAKFTYVLASQTNRRMKADRRTERFTMYKRKRLQEQKTPMPPRTLTISAVSFP